VFVLCWGRQSCHVEVEVRRLATRPRENDVRGCGISARGEAMALPFFCNGFFCIMGAEENGKVSVVSFAWIGDEYGVCTRQG